MGFFVWPDSTNKDVSMTYTSEQLRKIFMKFDTNGDKLLSRDELKRAFNHLGALFPGYRAGQGLSYADANDDGHVDEEELKNLVKFAFGLGYTVK